MSKYELSPEDLAYQLFIEEQKLTGNEGTAGDIWRRAFVRYIQSNPPTAPARRAPDIRKTKAELGEWAQFCSRTPNTVLAALIAAGLCSDEEPKHEQQRLFHFNQQEASHEG